jgi:hypothetical protein
MGIVIGIKPPYKNLIEKWKHKLFSCPTFWKSKWNTFWKSKPFYRCPDCNKAMHCYWDGNDVADKGINLCDVCMEKGK